VKTLTRNRVAVSRLLFNPVATGRRTRPISCKFSGNIEGEEIKVNRKLIRTTLAEVKGRETAPQPRERSEGAPSRPMQHRSGPGAAPRESRESRDSRDSSASSASSAALAAMGRKKIPPAETSAEIFYYKKQMDQHTLMVMVLVDGEEVEGTIEWYDRSALKINRKGAPNIMLLKHNIKYMFKAEDRDGGGSDSGD
jgi:sRNA-binding regulator protein Hfq